MVIIYELNMQKQSRYREISYLKPYIHTYIHIYILAHPPSQLSLWEETGEPGENPRLSVECWQTLPTLDTGIEPMTSVVGGRRLDDWATEAPQELSKLGVKYTREFMCRFYASSQLTQGNTIKNIKYTAFYCFTRKFNMFDWLLWRQQMTTLHSPDNLQTRWSDLQDH